MASPLTKALREIRPRWRIRANGAEGQPTGNTTVQKSILERVVAEARADHRAKNAALPRHQRLTTNPKKLRRLAKQAALRDD